MAVTVTSTRKFRAMPVGDDNGVTHIDLREEIETTVRDSAGRNLYSHPQWGKGARAELATMTLPEACALLRDLTDVITWLLTSEKE